MNFHTFHISITPTSILYSLPLASFSPPLSLKQRDSPLSYPRENRVYSHRARAGHVLLRRNDSDSDIQLNKPQSFPTSSASVSVLHHSESLDDLNKLSEGEKVCNVVINAGKIIFS